MTTVKATKEAERRGTPREQVVQVLAETLRRPVDEVNRLLYQLAVLGRKGNYYARQSLNRGLTVGEALADTRNDDLIARLVRRLSPDPNDLRHEVCDDPRGHYVVLRGPALQGYTNRSPFDDGWGVGLP